MLLRTGWINRRGEGHTLGNLAFAYHALGEYRRALAQGQAALDIFTAIEAPQAQAMRDLLKKWK
jgi:hypothetical protein